MTGAELDDLLKQYGARLSGLCYSLCKNEPDADDLFQETCLRLMKSRFAYRDEGALLTYIYRTCVNAYRDVYRAAKRRREVFPDEEERKYIESIPDKTGDREDYELLYRCLNGLPYKYKTIIILSYFRDLSEKDISEILKIPVGTVKSRLYRAKKLLKKELEKSEAD